MYKIIACDLDETLLSDDRSMAEPLVKIKEVNFFILKGLPLKKQVSFINEV